MTAVSEFIAGNQLLCWLLAFWAVVFGSLAIGHFNPGFWPAVDRAMRPWSED